MGDESINDSKIIHRHKPQSFGSLFLNNKNEDIGYISYIEDDIALSFPDKLVDAISKKMQEIDSKKKTHTISHKKR